MSKSSTFIFLDLAIISDVLQKSGFSKTKKEKNNGPGVKFDFPKERLKS
jgi:hypothetical protein